MKFRLLAQPVGPGGARVALIEDEAVWSLLLQHAWDPLDQQVVCKLLCCSRGMAAVVNSSCAGRLSVCLHGRGSAQLGHETTLNLYFNSLALSKWLARHHHLVNELVLGGQPKAAPLGPTAPDIQLAPLTQRFAASAVTALQQQLLRLSPLCTPAVPPFPKALRQVGRTLTRLDWVLSSTFSPKKVVKALLQLQALQHLSLTCVDVGSGAASLEHLGPALQQLTKLTALEVNHFSISKASTNHLPPSLRQLKLGVPLPRLYQRAMREQRLQLQHITQLRTLQAHHLKGCDVLPPGLKAIHVSHCSPLPLLRLAGLQELHIEADAPESLLAQLCNLPQLQDVQLSYKQPWSLSESGCTALQQLPLKALQCQLAADQLHLLEQCVQLTSLQLQLEGAGSSQVQQQLAQHITHLTALEALSLTAAAHQPSEQQVVLQQGDGSAGTLAAAAAAAGAAAATELVQGLCSLPALKHLELQGLCLGEAAAAQLAAATHITHLQLPSCQTAAVGAGVAALPPDEVASSSKVARDGTAAPVTILVHSG